MAARVSDELIDFMKTNELLECVTAGAAEYIDNTIKTRNKADYKKLKKLFDEQCFEAKSFEDSELNILTFDWRSLERDRNWWWQIQALPFLNWYVNCFALQSEGERSRYFLACLEAINGWIDQAMKTKASPLAWHDHAAAFRVRNLTNWLVFCHSVGLPVNEEIRAEVLGGLIVEHIEWLQEDNHFSKHTNHGFDQAMIALTIASMFEGDDFKGYRKTNRERLKDEVMFAFTDEGVHKENSPGYQKTMLGRLKQLRTLAPLGEQEISQMGERYIAKAENFLRVITLPSGYLPMIGDTRGWDEGLAYEQKDQVDVLDYSASGYVVIRGVGDDGLEFFLLFKNTHESNYHRHDDDLMIFLDVDGETVFGDGGLGMHHESDPRRKHLRSPYSHSVPLVNRSFIKDKSKLPAAPYLAVDKKSCLLTAVSMGFGVKVKRIVDYSRLVSGVLVVEDQCDESSLSSNWCFSGDKVWVSCEEVGLSYSSFSVKLKVPVGEPIKLVKGWNKTDISNSSIMSESYGKFIDSLRVVVGGGESSLKVELAINKAE
jgi:hypothetical protein